MINAYSNATQKNIKNNNGFIMKGIFNNSHGPKILSG